MLRYLDLFAGAGGISLGLKAAGFSCVGVVEMDDRAAASYRLNFPDHTDEAALIRLRAAEGDARLLKPHQVQRTLARAGVGEGELDLLVAGPPCQGFTHMQTQAFGGRGPTTQEKRWSREGVHRWRRPR
ncbi:MAG: DNA cytosine methyltransferase [Rubrobacter sp.]